jgi:AcrR family transcriptional regulator
MSTQIERSSATRATILKVARVAFVRDGYDGVSLDRIAKEAGVTKGALYHHYYGKEALFAALFSGVALEVVTTVGQRAGRTGSPRKRLKAAAAAWLKVVEEGDARAILLNLGPRVLGYARVRELEDAVALEPLLGLVQTVIDTEGLEGALDGLLAARLINAALGEIALLRHGSDGQAPTTQIANQAIAGVIDGVLKRSSP